MSHWLNTVEDVRALGIRVDQDQEDVLNNGGAVLVIQCLPAPGCYEAYSDFWPAKDIGGDYILVAGIMHAYPLSREWDAEVWEGITYTQKLGTVMDEQTGSEHWSYWPSYVGEFDRRPLSDSTLVFDNVHAVRIWCATPIASIGMNNAMAIVKACNLRVKRSYWGLVDECMVLLDGPKPLSAANNKRVSEIVNIMASAGLWKADDSNTWSGEILPYQPMSALLADTHALDIWNYLVVRALHNSMRAYNSIPEDKKPAYLQAERYVEPWL